MGFVKPFPVCGQTFVNDKVVKPFVKGPANERTTDLCFQKCKCVIVCEETFASWHPVYDNIRHSETAD